LYKIWFNHISLVDWLLVVAIFVIAAERRASIGAIHLLCVAQDGVSVASIKSLYSHRHEALSFRIPIAFGVGFGVCAPATTGFC
jgi:hypothetical protein